MHALAQADIATYQGADRTQKLVEGAKKEGTLTIYTSATTEDMAALTSAFEKKFGVKAVVWRASSENIIQRASTERIHGSQSIPIATGITPTYRPISAISVKRGTP